MGQALHSSKGQNVSIDLDSQEVQDAIAAKIEEATKGLKTKNEELLGKLKKAQKDSAIDPADLEAVEKERDQFRTERDDAKKALKKATTDAETAVKAKDAAKGFVSKLLVENGLNEALAKSGVTNAVHLKAAKAMLASQVEVVAEGDTKTPKVGDKALADFVTEWAGSEEGKHFVTAPDTEGGGSHTNGHKANQQPKGDSGGDKAAMVARANELLKAHEE